MASTNASLVRGLTLTAATSVNIANMIGTGIFLKTRVMTCNVGTPGRVLAVWVLAGMLAFAGALTYAELGAMMPRAGGEYVFIREAYGPRWAFLFGWTQFWIARTAAQAALAVGFAIFLNIVTGGALDRVYVTVPVFGGALAIGRLQLVALGTLALTTVINCGAVAFAGRIALGLTALKVALVLAVGVGAFLVGQGQWAHLGLTNIAGACDGVSAAARGGTSGFAAAMLGALWAYDGWNNVAPLAGEVQDPQRTLPRAFLWSTAIVGALYVGIDLAYFYVLTPTEIANVSLSSSVATDVVRRFMGAGAVAFIAAALMTSSFGALHTSVLASARVPYAMARDGMFFRALSVVSPRTHVPVRALMAQGVWAAVLALSSSYDRLSDTAIFALWIFYGLTTASVFVFRIRRPDADRPYRTWGYPVVPAVFLLVAVWLLGNTVLTAPRDSLIGVGLIALGLPMYSYWSRRAR